MLLSKAQALLHVGRDADAAAAGDAALAMIDRNRALLPYELLALDWAAIDNLTAGHFARALALYDQEIPLLDASHAALAERNRLVARLSRAASAVGASVPARALVDLDYVEGHLHDPKTVAMLQWPHASADHVTRAYRLISSGLRAKANRELGRLDAEAEAIRVRRAILDEELGETNRVEIAREEMLAESQLALNASKRHDAASTASWLGRALARADDLHSRASGVSDKQQLDVLWLAAELTVSMGAPLVADLSKRIAAASAEMAARREPSLRSYARWLRDFTVLSWGRRARRPSPTRLERARRPVRRLSPEPPRSDERLAQIVARRVRDDELRTPATANHDRVLSEHAAEGDCLVAVHSMDHPGGLPPCSLRVVFVADTSLDSVNAEDEQIAHHLMTLLVDFPRKEHRTRIVRRQHGEGLQQELGKPGGVGDRVPVERDADRTGRGRELVNSRQVAAQKVLIHRGREVTLSGGSIRPEDFWRTGPRVAALTASGPCVRTVVPQLRRFGRRTIARFRRSLDCRCLVAAFGRGRRGLGRAGIGVRRVDRIVTAAERCERDRESESRQRNSS